MQVHNVYPRCVPRGYCMYRYVCCLVGHWECVPVCAFLGCTCYPGSLGSSYHSVVLWLFYERNTAGSGAREDGVCTMEVAGAAVLGCMAYHAIVGL